MTTTMLKTPAKDSEGVFLEGPVKLVNGKFAIALTVIGSISIYLLAGKPASGSWQVAELINGNLSEHPAEYDQETAFEQYLDRVNYLKSTLN